MFCVSVTFVLLAMYLEGRFVQWENKEAWRLSTQVLSNKGTDCHRQLVHDRTTEQNTTNFNNKITSKLCWFSITLLISFSSENFNIIVNREIQKVFFSRRKKWTVQTSRAATSHSCSFYVFSSALVAILVSSEQGVNWPQLSCLCELACKKTSKYWVSFDNAGNFS